jgi:hypothetical protein
LTWVIDVLNHDTNVDLLMKMHKNHLY